MAVWSHHEYDHLFKLVLIESNQESNKSKFLKTFFKPNETGTGGGGGKANKPGWDPPETRAETATGKLLYYTI